MHVKVASPAGKVSSSALARASPPGRQSPTAAASFPGLHSFSDVAVDAPLLQRKLVIGAADDPLEREADRVAEQVMGMPSRSLAISPTLVRLRHKCAAC